MKLKFSPEFTGDKLEVQIGDLRFSFDRKNEPFEFENPLFADHFSKRKEFVVAEDTIQAVNANQETSPKKK